MKQKLIPAGPPLVVATAHTPRGLAEAVRLRPGDADIVEARLDCFARRADDVRDLLPRLGLPAILTARHHKDQMEGDGAVGCFDAAAAAEELHAAGLLAPKRMRKLGFEEEDYECLRRPGEAREEKPKAVEEEASGG